MGALLVITTSGGRLAAAGGMSTEREANLMVAKTFGILDINLLAVCNFNRDAVD